MDHFNRLASLKQSGKILASALSLSKNLLTPNITTLELDSEIHSFILKQGATPSFLGYQGFTNSSCISVNTQIVHGVPTSIPLITGDLVTIDIGVSFNGYCTDAARTYIVDDVENSKKNHLILTVQKALNSAIVQAIHGNTTGDISFAIQRDIELNGYKSPLELGGHGINKTPHELPFISNTGVKGRGSKIYEGMCLALEPIAMAGTRYIVQYDNDDWTFYSEDGELSSHTEDTILVTTDSPIVLTRETLEGGVI